MKRILLFVFCALITMNSFSQTRKKTTTAPKAKTTTTTTRKSNTTKKATTTAQTPKKTTQAAKKTTSSKAAQTPKKKTTQQKPATIKQLKNQQSQNQKVIKEKKAETQQLNKSIKSNLDSVVILDRQITGHQNDINRLKGDIKSLNSRIDSLQTQLNRLTKDLEDRKVKYAKAVTAMQRNHNVQDKLMFIFSAQNLTQMYRRMRYVREYSAFQKAQGDIIRERHQQVQALKNDLLDAKTRVASNLMQVEDKKKSLEGMKTSCESKVAFLNKNLQQVQKEIAAAQAEDAKLQAQIDRLIQLEIEAEKKRQAEAARKAREAEEKRKAEEARKLREKRLAEARAAAKKAEEAKKAAKNAEEKKRAEAKLKAANAEVKNVEKENKKEEAVERKTVAKARTTTDTDTKLSSNFASNKGRLPMPITGSYSIVGHYGRYNVPGLKGVVLENKGINIKGQAGAMARAVFDGEVTGFYEYGPSYTVMVRHGKYISVYSGLSSVSVSKGQKVSTKTPLGKVGTNTSGDYVLQFQLRTLNNDRLNPEAWVR
ncbi:MAG: peptidoglycan DD-metalloendopeptidase family protein [Bacteroidaceae bacterium]|nr:peptidoglycan DD-metalloendopeptidase family protein [Bacteroidaceae bacterium]